MRELSFAIFSLSFIFITVSCDQLGITKPSVAKEHQGAVVDHSGFVEGDCNECHEAVRPVAIEGDIHGESGDCGKCHSYSRDLGWKSLLPFEHEPSPEKCRQCHEPKRPITETHVKIIDCKECHTNPDWSVIANFDHDPHPSTCITCHIEDRPSATHYDGKDCMGCHHFPQWSEFSSFDHNTNPSKCGTCHEAKRPALPHPATDDCKSCHSFGYWADAKYEHPAALATCGEYCHARPTEDANRAYATGKQGPPADFAATDYPGSGHMIGKDCAECHLTPTDGVQKWGFDHVKPVLGFCLPCHYNQGDDKHGPTSATYELSQYGNCTNCHTNYDKDTLRNWSFSN